MTALAFGIPIDVSCTCLFCTEFRKRVSGVELFPKDPKRAASAHKPRMSVVPSEVLDEIVAAFTEGANKYGVLNWRQTKDVHASTYFDATMRHLRAWWKREDIDAESNIHHLSKAIASLMVLRDAQLCHVCTDDRPELPSASDD